MSLIIMLMKGILSAFMNEIGFIQLIPNDLVVQAKQIYPHYMRH